VGREPNYRNWAVVADTLPSVGRADRHSRMRAKDWCISARLRRAEVALVKKRREEWWECPNQFCGTQIFFLMLGPNPGRADPTCFCGSEMRRVVKTRGQRYGSSGVLGTAANVRRATESASTHPPPTRKGAKEQSPSNATNFVTGARRG
jgi:hypothetical protein